MKHHSPSFFFPLQILSLLEFDWYSDFVYFVKHSLLILLLFAFLKTVESFIKKGIHEFIIIAIVVVIIIIVVVAIIIIYGIYFLVDLFSFSVRVSYFHKAA